MFNGATPNLGFGLYRKGKGDGRSRLFGAFGYRQERIEVPLTMYRDLVEDTHVGLCRFEKDYNRKVHRPRIYCSSSSAGFAAAELGEAVS